MKEVALVRVVMLEQAVWVGQIILTVRMVLGVQAAEAKETPITALEVAVAA
jgi:hypothetical protein